MPFAEVNDLGIEDVNVAGSGPYVAGLAGSGGTVTRCYTSGAVRGGEFVGGLMGDKSGAVSYCYSHCVVSGTGLVGGLLGSNTDGEVKHCYSAGEVSGIGLSFGGLVGLSNGGVLYSVWDMETSGRSGSAGGVGLTTTEMMDPYMLGLNGFGGDPNWVLRAGRDYPRLAWEESITVPVIDWLQGRGTADEPYRLDTAEQLIRLGRAGILWNKHFILGADIDLNPDHLGVPPFGQAVIPSFSGVFDGNNRTISYLMIQGVGHLGLFGDLESGAEVKNLGVMDVSVSGSGNYVGELVGINLGGYGDTLLQYGYGPWHPIGYRRSGRQQHRRCPDLMLQQCVGYRQDPRRRAGGVQSG
jgi:hypothetical protein